MYEDSSRLTRNYMYFEGPTEEQFEQALKLAREKAARKRIMKRTLAAPDRVCQSGHSQHRRIRR